ncbi:MAG: MarR family transcriptional regulator [Candidatus Diapherotrites archaeon]|nr:MarR family transcriptional regulator [Candidatus Diapherotrites archaeon]
MLQEILDSKGKIRLLELLLERPYSFSVSELGRLAGIPKATASLIVKDWEKAGLVETEHQGRNKLVKINKKFQLLSSLKNIFRKSKNYHKPFFKKLGKLPSLNSDSVLAAAVFGSRARGDFEHSSDLDVMIAVENKNDSITEKISSELVELSKETGIRFSPTFLDKKEIIERIREKDQFLQNILKEGKILRGEKLIEHLQASS